MKSNFTLHLHFRLVAANKEKRDVRKVKGFRSMGNYTKLQHRKLCPVLMIEIVMEKMDPVV